MRDDELKQRVWSRFHYSADDMDQLTCHAVVDAVLEELQIQVIDGVVDIAPSQVTGWSSSDTGFGAQIARDMIPPKGGVVPQLKAAFERHAKAIGKKSKRRGRR